MSVHANGTQSQIGPDQATSDQTARPPSAHILDINDLPIDMVQMDRWVVWAWKYVAGKPKWDKPPIDPLTGLETDATDPKNWMTCVDSARLARKRGDGSGFQLGTADDRSGFVVLDIDHCVKDGKVSDRAMALVLRFNSYAEFTPTDGIRIWIRGHKPGGRCCTRKHPDEFLRTVEIYSHGRYVTVTGRRLEQAPAAIAARQGALDDLYAEMFSAPVPHRDNGRKPPTKQVDVTDEELLGKARAAANGGDFAALYDRGDTSRDGERGQNSSDLALMNHLAFWTGCDFGRMERLFSASALGKREKWTGRQDYRHRTINLAIADCTSTYEPHLNGQASTSPDRRGAEASDRPAFTPALVSSSALCAPVAPPEWLIKGVLVAGQPAVLGGPMKTLKTSILIDMTISIGTGNWFLGRFPVPRARRVGLISGESGRFVIRANARELAMARGIDLEHDPNILWGFNLPDLTDDGHLKALGKMIGDHGLEVLAIDPIYLCIPDKIVDHKNMFSFGPVLDAFGQVCLEVGCTPILSHHFTKSREDPYAPPQVHELAYGGISQWMRQWMLVARREPYASGVPHKLHWVHGGSFGHSGELSLDIDTGDIDEDFNGRKWEVSVATAGQAIQARQEEQDAAKIASKVHAMKLSDEAKHQAAREDVCKVADLLRDPGDRPMTARGIRDRLGWGQDRAARAITQLVSNEAVREIEMTVGTGKGAKRTCTGYVLIK
jgi:hypothetical protein